MVNISHSLRMRLECHHVSRVGKFYEYNMGFPHYAFDNSYPITGFQIIGFGTITL